MSYVSWKERSVRLTNRSEWQLSCCDHPCIQLHNSPHRPGEHDWDIWNCLWYVMEIEGKELDKEWWRSRAIFTKNWWNDLHAVNCRPKARECDRATSFHTQITLIAVDQKVRGNKTPGCKRSYIQTQYWMSKMCIWFVAYNYWVYKGCFDVINVCVNRVPTMLNLTHSAINGLHYSILPKWLYRSALLRKQWMTRSLPHP